MELYNYFRSSASYRVRIALALKGLDYDYMPVHLVKGEQQGESYAAVSPSRLVPLLKDGDALITQSLAIIEYLDETNPEPPLLPRDALGRARVRALAQDIACEIHPLNNLRVLQHLKRGLGQDEAAINTWYRHWVAEGLAKFEADLTKTAGTGAYCHGDTPTMADCCLVPQIFNAKRYECDLAPYPVTMRAFDACMKLDAFDRAQPMKQPDAE
jgi:maleylacetoacetate isomerase/maleylpyruvate isomerase